MGVHLREPMISLLVFSALAAIQDPSPASASLVSSVRSVQPGKPFTVGVRVTMEPRWHIYWKNPGDSGMPTTIQWKLPEGWRAVEMPWPVPMKFDGEGMPSFGYKDEVLLLTRIVPPPTAKAGTRITLAGTARWLACEESCIPGQGDFKIDLPITETPQADAQWGPKIQAVEERLPRAMEGWNAVAERSGGNVVLRVATQHAVPEHLEKTTFFPLDQETIAHGPDPKVQVRGGGFALIMPPSEMASKPPARLRGLLVAPPGQVWQGKTNAIVIDVPIRQAG
jgi:DsbC/DsbD-like thiol-disulfide interchange protein